jgi:hypothetical protein
MCSRGKTQRRSAHRLASVKPISQTLSTMASAHSLAVREPAAEIPLYHLDQSRRTCEVPSARSAQVVLIDVEDLA